VGRDRHRPDAGVRLWWANEELPLEPYDGLSDVDHAGVEVELADPQPTDLAGPQPAPAGEEQRRPPRLRYGSQVTVQLVDSEHLDIYRPLLLTARLHPAGIGLDDALLDGLLEDRLQQSVGVGLWVGVVRIPEYQVEISAAVMSSSGRFAQVGRTVRRSSFAYSAAVAGRSRRRPTTRAAYSPIRTGVSRSWRVSGRHSPRLISRSCSTSQPSASILATNVTGALCRVPSGPV
jgi:hypothetical protein